MNTATDNPLLDFSGLPRFDVIEPAHVASAIDHLLKEADAALEEVTAPEFPADWSALSARLDVSTERLSRAWGAVGHLNGVADTPELRAAYNAVEPAASAFSPQVGGLLSTAWGPPSNSSANDVNGTCGRLSNTVVI